MHRQSSKSLKHLIQTLMRMSGSTLELTSRQNMTLSSKTLHYTGAVSLKSKANLAFATAYQKQIFKKPSPTKTNAAPFYAAITNQLRNQIFLVAGLRQSGLRSPCLASLFLSRSHHHSSDCRGANVNFQTWRTAKSAWRVSVQQRTAVCKCDVEPRLPKNAIDSTSHDVVQRRRFDRSTQANCGSN